MTINLINTKGTTLAQIASEAVVLNSEQDAVEILANCAYQGATNIILNKENITSDFFDLKTGLAGEVLQKFSNYRGYLAIIGDFSNLASKSLKDFIYESNKTGRINFVNSIEAAIEALTR